MLGHLQKLSDDIADFEGQDTTDEIVDEGSETASLEMSSLLKLSTYHFGNCKEFQVALEDARDEDMTDSDLRGRTAFTNLAAFGCAECLQRLQETIPTCVDQEDDEGCTALMTAAAGGNSDCVRLLLQWSSSVDKRDASKNTALHHSLSSSSDRFSVECVLALLKHSSEVNALNDSQTTPLLQAIFSGTTQSFWLFFFFPKGRNFDPYSCRARAVPCRIVTTARFALKSFGA